MKTNCLDCKIILEDYRRLRCKKCYGLSISGRKNPNWKGGNLRNNCEDCGKKITRRAKRCKSCGTIKCKTGTKQPKSFSEKMSIIRKGENNNFWKGGKINIDGYIYIKVYNHPNKNARGYIAKHRLIMEKNLNRYLTKKEVIHHKNGIRDDNKIENLQLFKNQSEHISFHRINGGENK